MLARGETTTAATAKFCHADARPLASASASDLIGGAALSARRR
jgi:hypothetical protein